MKKNIIQEKNIDMKKDNSLNNKNNNFESLTPCNCDCHKISEPSLNISKRTISPRFQYCKIKRKTNIAKQREQENNVGCTKNETDFTYKKENVNNHKVIVNQEYETLSKNSTLYYITNDNWNYSKDEYNYNINDLKDNKKFIKTLKEMKKELPFISY